VGKFMDGSCQSTSYPSTGANDMLTDTIKIILQLFLVVGGGIMVGLLAILLFILVGAFGAWLAIQIASLKNRDVQRT
jgi:hypothetical protein